MICKYCGKECKNANSLRNHERLCKSNPERQTTYFSNKENQKKLAELRDKAGQKNQWSNPDYKMSESTRRKLSENTSKRNMSESQETRDKRKATIAEKVKNGEWHTSLAKHHHYNYNGVDLHGRWELNYAKWLDENNIEWKRCKDSFSYTFEGKERRYTPDFYLVESDTYIEIKGYKTEKDDAKWSQFPDHRTLVVLMKEELESLGVI